ncbi:MAG: acyltransferase [Ferruginibacter sp.]|nr:acyltransferase [Ferruginibacter sp.]
MTETPTSAVTKNEKIDFKVLDGLRGIAATYVVINHARGNLFIGGAKYSQLKDISLWTIPEKIYFSALQLTSLGREFVIVFFILSGFSIAFSLNTGHRTGDFYLRRLIRIYPPYLVALVWAFVVFMLLYYFAGELIPAGSASVFDTAGAALKNIFYIDNGSFIPQFWSLKFEVIFYLLVPFFVLKRDFYFIVSALIYVVSFFMSWNNNTAATILGQYVLDYNIYFAIGVCCFHYRKQLEAAFSFKNRYLFYAVAVFLFLLMVGLKFIIKYDLNKVTLLVASLFSVTLLFNFLFHNIKNRLLMFLGNISYTIYITHFASIMLLLAILLKTGVISSIEIQNKFLWLLGIPFAVAISYVFYLLVEKPSKNLLVKLRKKAALT